MLGIESHGTYVPAFSAGCAFVNRNSADLIGAEGYDGSDIFCYRSVEVAYYRAGERGTGDYASGFFDEAPAFGDGVPYARTDTKAENPRPLYGSASDGYVSFDQRFVQPDRIVHRGERRGAQAEQSSKLLILFLFV